MKRFNHAVLVPDTAVASDSVVSHDLPINPLSLVLINIKPLNDNAGLNNFASYLDLCDSLNAVRVYRQGQSVINARGIDLAAMNYFRSGICPLETNNTDADNIRRSAVLPLFFGAFPYDDTECLPKSSARGDVVLELDIDVADTGYDGFTYSIETVELFDAKPRSFLRQTTLAQTLVVGDNDLILSARGSLRGLLVQGATAYTTGSPAPTAGRFRTLFDNSEWGYQTSDWESLRALPSVFGRQPFASDSHFHRLNAASASGTEPTDLDGPAGIGNVVDNYVWLEFDPTRDGSYSPDLSKFNSSVLRTSCETAGAIRVVTCESVSV